VTDQPFAVVSNPEFLKQGAGRVMDVGADAGRLAQGRTVVEQDLHG